MTCNLLMYTGTGNEWDRSLARDMNLVVGQLVGLEEEYQTPYGTTLMNVSLIPYYLKGVKSAKSYWFTSNSFEEFYVKKVVE